MYKCLKVTFRGDFPQEFLRGFIQQSARDNELEGSAQMIERDRASVVVCGSKEQVDFFLDQLHKELAAFELAEVEIEPFLKEKDYRGVFRVIE